MTTKPTTEIVNANDFRYIALSNDRYIRPSLKYYGEYYDLETKLLARFLSEDSIALDIGANIGTHTLAFAKAVPQGEVWSFEAQKFVHQILCGNIALNGFQNVRAFHCAVGKESGEIGVPTIDYNTPDNYGGLGLRATAGGPTELYETTPMITIDSLQLPDVDLMKVDVDGMDEEVLRGSFQTIFKYKPVIYIEADRPEQRAGLVGFLGTLGYRVWEHKPELVKAEAPLSEDIKSEPDPKVREQVQHLKTIYAENFLCIPKDRIPPDDIFFKEFKLKPVLG